ncbi:hypothetical protein [Candidatus Desulforudis audaxviator]|uniref:Uncharacterized protein n=1 Tax=Desulforudis audaxviator (strain MP104C) TaxID=477974 RepID=B1I3E4_DESAP|nr:hypothetical protein [Candidatus Desulforudis audaxviator]ACA59489.1 hypothetical protein Daud_0977 [Candidatus Desulforudis audaxviator MP104C]AZK59472.1 Type IV pilus biogenesis protein PilO [Candidatus Desulforudis audaxviator]
MWQNLSERQRLLVMVAATVLVFALLYLLVLSRQISAFQRAGAALEATSAELQQYRAKAARFEVEKEREAASQIRLEELSRHFDTNYQSGTVLVMLGIKALEEEVFIAGLKPGAVIERTGYLVLPVELEFWSTYASCLSLINYLENLGNLVHVLNLEIQQYFGGNDLLTVFEHGLEPVVRTKVTLAFYTVPDAGQELYGEVMRIQEWSQGRGTRAFQYPGELFGKVSPHFEVRMGGEVPLLYLVTLPEPEQESGETTGTGVRDSDPPTVEPAPEVREVPAGQLASEPDSGEGPPGAVGLPFHN